MADIMFEDMLAALAATAELCGARLTPAAARLLALDLAEYPLPAVVAALARVRRELDGGRGFCLKAITDRIDDGRPGVEQAWAMLPRDEHASVVWTEDMREAWAAALPLLVDGDRIAARMAFKEAYTARVTQARAERRPVCWGASLGMDRHARGAVVAEAVRLGRLSADAGTLLLGHAAPALAAPAPVGIAAGNAGLAGSNARLAYALDSLRVKAVV